MFIFGAVWFTVLFGKMWAKEMDFNPAGDEKAKAMGMNKPLILNFISNLVLAAAFYQIYPEIMLSPLPGYKMLLLMWVAFSLPIFANAAIWERKSWKLVLINSAQSLISIFILTGVMYYFR